MPAFKELTNRILSLVKDTAKLNRFTNDDISDILDENIAAHEVITQFSTMISTTSSSAAISLYNKNKRLYKDQTTDIFDELLALYPRAIKELVLRESMLTPIIKANEKFIKILKQIKKDIDKIIVEKEITINNTRVSHLALLGLLRQSEMFGKYSTYLLDQFVRYGTRNTALPIGYRVNYMVTHKADFVKIMSDVLMKNDKYSFLNEVNTMRSKNVNTLLYANSTPFTSFFNINSFTSSVTSFLTSGVSSLNIFMFIGNLWTDYQHDRYLRNKQTKEFLENNLALLQMALSDMNKDDPKYQRQVELVKSNSAMLAKLDKKINDYLNKSGQDDDI